MTVDHDSGSSGDTPLKRRAVLGGAIGAAGAAALGWSGYELLHKPENPTTAHVSEGTPLPSPFDGRKLEIAILVAPGYWPVDIVSAYTAFGMIPGVNPHLVWKNTDEVIGVPTFPTRPTTSYEDCPRDLDVLYAGATASTNFEDAQTLEFLADRGARARWIAGSCTGPLLLGAAGLFKGYRATANFQAAHLLPYVGAIHSPGNVVEDRNRITAGPATGGFEIAVRLIQAIYGDEAARETILQAEYAPTPLFDVGTPALAGPELTARTKARTAPMIASLQEVMKRVATRLQVS
ncbi:DJ-1/PfpI family protein [Nocardia tenerifensis]|uniref:DJ-1/PfpI family protein n=1 Tax=Nocardia tenerifensis TaxID=228006 RepID=A0A318JMA9_9NOCA|nr:DJ-1/PfpI family protein [Nocardia tenerifensis]PXX54933.1 DJ-1/PfpI family protein [Nocardia tenerifensis]